MAVDDPGIARKERTIARLKHMGIPTLDWLPHISDEEIKLRSPREVAERTVALCAVAVHAEMHHTGRTEPFALRFLEYVGLTTAPSPQERSFLDVSQPSERDIVQYSWRYEACATLLWALRLLEPLPSASEICDVPVVSRLARQLGEDGIETAQLRSKDEIADQLDLAFRLHWATRNAELMGAGNPK